MRKLATIRRVRETRAIEGADAIELTVVDGWKCVTEKIDGTSFTAFVHEEQFGVCGRNWQLIAFPSKGSPTSSSPSMPIKP